MQIRYRDKIIFCRADLTECGEPFSGPGCGWYHIYTFTAKPREGVSRVEEETWLDEACLKEQLALVLIDIGHFRACEFSEEAVSHMGQIMEFFRARGKQMILRFAYDIQGAGMAKEPSGIGLVRRQMEQLGGLFCEYAGDILVIQGIFVGSWGEMHGSRFLRGEDICTLLGTLYKVTEGRCFLSVRTPAQRRMVLEDPAVEQGLKEKLGLYNDGIFGSGTDLGTYGVLGRKVAKAAEPWLREDELDWQEEYMDGVPNGGEALYGLPLAGYKEAAETMRKMHLTYLNSIYHPGRLLCWKEEKVEEGCFQGMSGYDYIGCHLGYRFVVRDARLREKRGAGKEREISLQITVENCGFASLAQEAECILTVEGEQGDISSQILPVDARRWRSGQRTQIEAALQRSGGRAGIQRLYLELRRKSDGKVIRFANQGAPDRVLLGECLDL